jgi:hypothetical protein
VAKREQLKAAFIKARVVQQQADRRYWEIDKQNDKRLEEFQVRLNKQKRVIEAARKRERAQAETAKLSAAFQQVVGALSPGDLVRVRGRDDVFVINEVETKLEEYAKKADVPVTYVLRRLTRNGTPSWLSAYREERLENDLTLAGETDPPVIRYRRREMRARLAGRKTPFWTRSYTGK